MRGKDTFVVKVCLHVTEPPRCLSKLQSKFNIVSIVMETLTSHKVSIKVLNE